MEIKLMFNAAVPGNACNLKCSYCYIGDKKNQPAEYEYPVEHMLKALSKERLSLNDNECAYIGFCSDGETLMYDETIDLIAGCINMGHLVCVVSNCTLSNKIDLLLSKINPKNMQNFLLRGSYHFLELKKKNLLDTFFDNLKKVISSGGNAYPYIVLSEDTIPYLDELIDYSVKKLGEKPHATPQLDFKRGTDFNLMEFYDKNLQKLCEEKFDSRILEVNTRILSQKATTHFCYAGQITNVLLLKNGDMMKCYALPIEQNIFKNLNKKIKFEPIGYNCAFSCCGCYHEMQGLGVQPDLNYPPLSELYQRTELFKKNFLNILSKKIITNNNRYKKEHEIRLSQKIKNKYKRIKFINKYFKKGK